MTWKGGLFTTFTTSLYHFVKICSWRFYVKYDFQVDLDFVSGYLKVGLDN